MELPWAAIDAGTPTGENSLSPSQQVSITKNFLVSGGVLCLLPLLSAGVLSGLDLCNHSLCEFVGYLAPLCLEDAVFLQSFTVPSSYNLSGSFLDP